MMCLNTKESTVLPKNVFDNVCRTAERAKKYLDIWQDLGLDVPGCPVDIGFSVPECLAGFQTLTHLDRKPGMLYERPIFHGDTVCEHVRTFL
jgi:hypothetical protein